MKKFLLFLIPSLFLFSACSTGDAEKVADEFHKKLDEGDVDYIMKNLVDTEDATENQLEEFEYALYGMVEMGEMKNRQKSTGFNKKYNNGTTTVKLAYTYEIEGTKMYESLVLVSRDEGYKVKMFAVNKDKAVVDSYTANF